MQIEISHNTKELSGNIDLPTSKSISNRLLILQALAKKEFTIHNLSGSEDTRLLLSGLKEQSNNLYAGAAGTTMRFLTALQVIKNREVVISGTPRMHNRPIKKLVDALIQLGANISYLEKDGYPPLKIMPAKLSQSKITIDGSVSSQYITALLLIGASLPNGLVLNIENQLVSAAYVKLTVNLMKFLGISSDWKDNVITVPHQQYEGTEITVEADWSGASYWYEMVSLSQKADITITGLQENSLQGDSVSAKLYERLGVKTQFMNNSIKLSKIPVTVQHFEHDFSDCPDLVQTLTATCIGIGVSFKMTGCETLYIKETDRVNALIAEAAKFGVTIRESSHGTIEWDGSYSEKSAENPVIDTYEDHRMALAFAPLALKFPTIYIRDPEVVTKSYPEYWNHLRNVGFEIN